ncbi:MAG: sugar O-acetyltransferase [Ruthenibacterium sp.]
MTEREKMLAGELYDCGDAELLAQWHKAKNLTRAYSNLASEDLPAKEQLLRQLLGGFGKSLWVTPPFFVDYGCNIFLGDNCEINANCTFLDCASIRIGSNALVAPNVQIYTAFHPASAQERFGTPRAEGSFAFCKTLTAPVTIGDNVWLGGGAILLPGVTLGDNVVIGAGSVVTHDIPSNSVAYGNPCQVIRQNL